MQSANHVLQDRNALQFGKLPSLVQVLGQNITLLEEPLIAPYVLLGMLVQLLTWLQLHATRVITP
jgi:hypothetical protein